MLILGKLSAEIGRTLPPGRRKVVFQKPNSWIQTQSDPSLQTVVVVIFLSEMTLRSQSDKKSGG